MKKTIMIAVVAVLVGGGIGFYGGMLYGQSQAGAARRVAGANFAGGGGQFGSGTGGTGGAGTRLRGGPGGNFQGGKILSKSDNSITIQATDGSSKIVFVSGTTNIMKSAQGTLDDLTVGNEVTVTGTANSDGSITAQSVQLRSVSAAQATPTQ